jgi:hypothetical protein
MHVEYDIFSKTSDKIPSALEFNQGPPRTDKWMINSTAMLYTMLDGHHPTSCLLFKTEFRKLDLFSFFRWYLLSWVQSTELVPVSGPVWKQGLALSIEPN